MELTVKTLGGDDAGTVTLSRSIFGLEPRPDILHRVVRWQLARRRSGTAKVKTRSDIDATGKKMYRQKGTGRARHSERKATQFRGGMKPHGPKLRDYAHDLPKKVRAAGLCYALSAKQRDGALCIVESAAVDTHRTKELKAKLDGLAVHDALIVDGVIDANFDKAVRNIPKVDVLPVSGINVYDILRRRSLVLTRSALEHLEARFAERVHTSDAASTEAG